MLCPEPPYADLEYANQYFSCIPGSLWDTYCEDDQLAALLAATSEIDIRYGMCYLAWLDNQDQDYLQPRDGYISHVGRIVKAGDIAKDFKSAVCLIAMKLLTAASDEINVDMHDGRRVKSFSQDSPDIFSESYAYFDDGADATESEQWERIDRILAPHLEIGCVPGEVPSNDGGLFVSDVCLG